MDFRSFSDGSQPSQGRLSIPERPIEAGVYSWGWVDYHSYDQAGNPSEISVVMFSEPSDSKRMGALRRWLSRPNWLNLLLCYGPLILGVIAVGSPGLAGISWISELALGTAVLSGWQFWKQIRNLRIIGVAVQLDANRNLENYSAGREFLRLLGQQGLSQGDIAAYFNLHAQTVELKRVISDDWY